jgi:predicted nucleotidyltransferase
MPQKSAHDELHLLAAWGSSLGIDGEYMLGGSAARGEQEEESDVDLYVYCSARNAWRVLARKKQFAQVFAGRRVSIFIIPRIIARTGIYYAEGIMADGVAKTLRCIPEVQARSALRTAYGALAMVALHKGDDSWYRMRKACRYALIAYGLSHGIIDPEDAPVFSFARAEQVVFPILCGASPTYTALSGLVAGTVRHGSYHTVLMSMLGSVAREVSAHAYPWQLRVLDAVSAVRHADMRRVVCVDEYEWYMRYASAIDKGDTTMLKRYMFRYIPCVNI